MLNTLVTCADTCPGAETHFESMYLTGKQKSSDNYRMNFEILFIRRDQIHPFSHTFSKATKRPTTTTNET